MTIRRKLEVHVRRLLQHEWALAFPVISQLRLLDEAEYLRRIAIQSLASFELVGAFAGERLIGVLGMRPVHTLARGPYVHVDDLIVSKEARGSGAGHVLMEFAEVDARERGMKAVFLDARPEAVPFYESRDYALHSAPSMKKAI